VREELLETDAVEEPAPPIDPADQQLARVRALPAKRPGTEVSIWRYEVRAAALAAAGGLVAGAATVAAVRAARAAARHWPGRHRSRERPVNVVASRSFLIDVHVLGSK
jgi:hypothetical protein